MGVSVSSNHTSENLSGFLRQASSCRCPAFLPGGMPAEKLLFRDNHRNGAAYDYARASPARKVRRGKKGAVGSQDAGGGEDRRHF